MTNRNTGLIVGAIVIAAVVALLIYSAARESRSLLGDTDATFTLREVNNVCGLTGKDPEVKVARGKKIIWTVRNFCKQPQTVTVGNFRTAASSAAANCQQATEGIEWPFNGNDSNLNKRQATAKGSNGSDEETKTFKLTDAKNTTGKPQDYQFDVCVGAGSGTKVDPRLVIDP
ncbi:MAG: hypothetical protein ABIQ52_19280 [Vicinamibacterales bacterium]